MPQTDSPSESKTKKTHFFLSLGFVLLVIGSSLGLDYINWKKGEKSYIFSHSKKQTPQKNEDTLSQLILNSFTAHSIPINPANSYRDDIGIYHLPVPVRLELYTNAAPLLHTEFQEAQISVRINHKSEETSDLFFWELEKPDGERASILFTCPKEIAVTPDEPEIPVIPDESQPGRPKNKVALIIDDMGNSIEALRDLVAIGHPMTVAVLPHSTMAAETARIARQYNLEVILHLPLESLNDQDLNLTTKGLIHSEMSEEEILQTLETNLALVPHIRGVNNHMGSKITAKREWMIPILTRLKERNLYFIDSVTAGRSIAYKLARELALPTAFRHVFLDAKTESDDILKQFKQLLRLAQRRGEAVGICHPLDTTLRVLAENFHLLEEYECEAVLASQIVK